MAANSTNTGNAGEHLVAAVLLARGHHAAMADRGNPAYDILSRYKGVSSAIRVKTSSSKSFQWTAKSEGLYLEYDPSDDSDFVVLVAFCGSSNPRDAEIYVIPTRVVVDDIEQTACHYYSFPKRDGTRRKVTNQRVIRLDGYDRPDNVSYNFGEKWRRYREAWHLLERPEDSQTSGHSSDSSLQFQQSYAVAG